MYLAASREITMLLGSFLKSTRPEELRSPAWDVTLILQSLTRAPYEPLQTSDERFLAQKMLLLLALASAKRIGKLHALLYRVSHSRDWGEVSFSFVLGFVAKTQDPSSSAPWFESFTVPAIPTRAQIAMGDCYVLCGQSDVTWTVLLHIARDVSGMFVTTGCSKEEIAKNTVSWLRKMISRAYQLSGQSLPDLPPRAKETHGITPSLLFKNFTVALLKVGTWRKHTTFTCHYLWDLAHRSLETFHLGPVVAAQAHCLTLAVRPGIPSLPGLMTDG